MTTYTASWPDKQTVAISVNENPFGKIEFENTREILYRNATLQTGDAMFEAKADGKNVVIKRDGVEIFTAIFHALWGSFELQMAGEETGYDIKGKWFKPGTRLTDAEDKDIVIVTADPWTGKEMQITAAEQASPLMIVATIYFHIRASAAKTMGVIIGNMP